MPLTTVSYSATSDTANGIVDDVSLEAEIRASDITVALDNVNILGDVINVVFKAAISGAAETTLDGIVAAHQGLPTITAPEFCVQEEKTKTGGHHAGGTIYMTVDNTADAISTHDESWPIGRNLLSLEFFGGPDYDGDFFTVDIGPNTPVGAITANVSAGATVITVSDTAINYLQPGYLVHLADGTNTDDLGMVLSKDIIAKTITVETATVNSFSAATPTFVQSTRRSLYPTYLSHSEARLDVGSTKIGGSYVPGGVIMRVTYTNKNTTNPNATKPFFAFLEWLY